MYFTLSSHKRIFIVSSLLIWNAGALCSQPFEKKLTPEEYILSHKEDAIKEMLLNGVPASITLAQAMLESGNGNSALAFYANNHFGIKCHKGWSGPSYIQDDDESNECFRKYEKVLDSYHDHSMFLKHRDRYFFLFNLPKTDYKAWSFGLKEAGYATHPNYAFMLIDLIEKYNLAEYDKFQDMIAIKSNASDHFPLPAMEMRKSVKYNGTKFIISKKGDSYFKIATELNLEMDQILSYNELKKTEKLEVGKKIYIQKKRRKAMEPYHVVVKGESMKSIAQLHGIRLLNLYRKNRMSFSDQPRTGEVLFLRKRKKSRNHNLNFSSQRAKS